MTTAAKPLPPHGERPRYLRGCRCLPCRDANKRYCKQYRVRTIRQPVRIDATPVRQRLQKWVDQGYSQTQIGAAVGKKSGDISKLLAGQATIAPVVAARILTSAGPTGAPAHARVDSTGTIRRAQALHAIGYPIYAIAESVPMATNHLGRILLREPATVSAAVARGMAALYKRWSEQPAPSHFAIHGARRRGWAPPICWDDDRIDDPAAHPDWTGYCGTDRGYWIHQLKKVPGCPRCDEAHQQWLADHAHLDGKQRAKALFSARATAMAREADLATDARELLRLRVGLDQAAARLGVTRDHLQQALRRHPETTEETGAAA